MKNKRRGHDRAKLFRVSSNSYNNNCISDYKPIIGKGDGAKVETSGATLALNLPRDSIEKVTLDNVHLLPIDSPDTDIDDIREHDTIADSSMITDNTYDVPERSPVQEHCDQDSGQGLSPTWQDPEPELGTADIEPVDYQVPEHLDSSDKKRKLKKKFKNNVYCGNCGKYGHIYRNCMEPITSIGIILVLIASDDESIVTELSNTLAYQTDEEIANGVAGQELFHIKTDGIVYDDVSVQTFGQYKDNIKFLMIRRKNTLGYIEFVRGHYNIDDIDGIIFLFKQMTGSEIKRIGTCIFDDLWDELWTNNKNKSNYHSEYTASKDKFFKLKNDTETPLNLDYYVTNVLPTWGSPEWGFPKGRRNHHESNIMCAVREFQEESGFVDGDFIVFDKIRPIEEKLVGTNAVSYKHIYYPAIATTNKEPEIDPNNHTQTDEIGDIGWFTYDQAIKLIRPYHTDRQRLLTELFMYIINRIADIRKQK